MFTSHMELALDQARRAAARGEAPIGAVLSAPDGSVLASAGNRVRELHDPTAHAEILVIRDAARVIGSERLMGCGLTVTLEPCAMCAGAISLARIGRLWYGASDPKGGAVAHGARVFSHPTCHHRPDIYGGIRETACAALLTDFFRERR
ncbi:MAG TPA: nucleoside deaminase [Paracoccaceae bacterium]|nr:nucleoside deaminase [Paracoccaceae bacterium]